MTVDLRGRVDAARHRLSRSVLGQLAQMAVAAGIAWELALQLPNHGRPFFAPIAAVISLGAERGRRGRQAVEMMTGVALGILVGAALLAVAGAGWWQLIAGTFVAIVAATAAGAPPMIRNQAAASVILVVALHTAGSNLAIQRLEDALLGGALAIAIARFLLPIDPVELVRGEARRLRAALASSLDEVATALESCDRGRADQALERVFALDDRRLMQALGVAREVARKAPRRRSMRRRIDKLGEVYRELEASVYDAHAIATGAVRLTDGAGPPPPEAAEAVRAVAAAVRAVEPPEARAAAEHAQAAVRALRAADGSLGAGVVAHGAVGVAEHTLRAAEAREQERRLAAKRR